MKPLPFSMSRLKTFGQCPKKFFHTTIKKDVREAENDAMREGHRVHKAFEERIKRGKPLPPDLAKHEAIVAKLAGAPGAIMAEKKLALNHELDPTEYFADDVHSRSVADVLIVGKKLVVVDWKTGKVRDDDEEQMRLTMSMALLTYPTATAASGLLIYTRENDRWPVEISREAAVPVYSEFVARAARIDKANAEASWPAKPSGLCKYCPVPKNKCPHKRL